MGNNIVRLTIKDGGKGFELSKVKKDCGLTAMQVRRATEHGDFSIVSEPEKGCRITALFPVLTNSEWSGNDGTNTQQGTSILS